MNRRKPLKRRVPVKPVNRERAAKRKARDFGEYADWIRQQRCAIVGGGHIYRVYQLRISNPVPAYCHAAHVRSRGAGGHAEHNLVPLCALHHEEQHRVGLRTFQKWYDVQLGAIAADLWGRYQRERETAKPVSGGLPVSRWDQGER